MTELLKWISVFSVGAGPFASDRVPAIAADLRPWAAWLSAIFSAVALVWANARLSRRRTIAATFSDLKWSIAAVVVSAVLYFVINLVWIRETGGPSDILFAIAIVLLYTICFSSLTFALVAGRKLTKRDSD